MKRCGVCGWQDCICPTEGKRVNLPKIFVFCNNCSDEWHKFTALSEDGVFLAGHICSHHGYAPHDMGVQDGGWKRDIYAKHFPQGFDVVMVDNPREHAELLAAYQRHLSHDKDAYAAKIRRTAGDTEQVVRHDPVEPTNGVR